jgi:hypothetical protein
MRPIEDSRPIVDPRGMHDSRGGTIGRWREAVVACATLLVSGTAGAELRSAPIDEFEASAPSSLPACPFVCNGTATQATTLADAARECKGQLSAKGCSLMGPLDLDGLDNPKVQIQLTNVELVGRLSLSEASILGLTIEGGTLGCPARLPPPAQKCELDLAGLRARSVIITPAQDRPNEHRIVITPRILLSDAVLSGRLELRRVDARNGIDANHLRTEGTVELSFSQFGCNDATSAEHCVNFSGTEASSFGIRATDFRSATTFNNATAKTIVDFSDSTFAWSLEAGNLKADKSVSLAGARFTGHEGAMANRGDATPPCADGGKGTSIELYSMATKELDLRRIVAPTRILNLAASKLELLGTGEAIACGLLMASARIESWHVDEPGTTGFSIGAVDARAATVRNFLSRSDDPPDAIFERLSSVQGGDMLIDRFEARLREDGQTEHANRIYVAIRRTEGLSPENALFYLTGDGRYPLWGYGLAFLAVWAVAVVVFWKRPPLWTIEHPTLTYSPFWFALDVVTPSLLDLGYRDVRVFDNRRSARWHGFLHVAGVVVLGVLTVAIGSRIP